LGCAYSRQSMGWPLTRWVGTGDNTASPPVTEMVRRTWGRMIISQRRARWWRVIMTCCRKATTCAATVRKGYITAGQYSPSVYQRELTLHRQHDSLYACQRQQTLCQQDGTRPYRNRGYTRRLMRKISGSEAFKAPMCTIWIYCRIHLSWPRSMYALPLSL
jgi:hypothetical protein